MAGVGGGAYPAGGGGGPGGDEGGHPRDPGQHPGQAGGGPGEACGDLCDPDPGRAGQTGRECFRPGGPGGSGRAGGAAGLPSSRGPGAGGGAGQPSHHPGRCGPQGPRVHPGDPAPGTAGAGALRGPETSGIPVCRRAGDHRYGERGTGPGSVGAAAARLRDRGGRAGLPVPKTGVPHGAAGGYRHRPGLWGGQPPGCAGPGFPGGAGDCGGGAHRGGRGHPGRRSAGYGGAASPGGGEGLDGHSQGYRQPGGGPVQGDRVRH